MKIQFSKLVSFQPEFKENLKLPEEQRIKLKVEPLKLDDLFKVMDALSDFQAASGDKIDAGDMKDIISEVKDIIPRYVKEFYGLEDESGPVSIDDVVTYPVYLDLAGEILMKLAEISMPSEAAAKN